MPTRTHCCGHCRGGRRWSKASLNLKESKLAWKLLDKFARMRIIGEHIRSPHEDLAQTGRSVYNRVNVSRQRNTAARIAVWRADVGRETSAILPLWPLTGMTLAGRIQPAS